MRKLFGLSEKQLISLLEYLAKQPYNQVAGFINELQSLQPFEVQQPKPVEPSRAEGERAPDQV